MMIEERTDYKFNTNLLELKFPELQKLGACCIADIDHVDLLLNLRHMYLEIAKSFCTPTRHAVDEHEFEMGELYCEFAEKIQDLIEIGYY